ncbi:MAG TPA: hypothetical protein VJR02_19770 [Pyrinomonadaceae bacterium]|nr:hypothetical protein [Pyrinomonadaceae bacterium]
MGHWFSAGKGHQALATKDGVRMTERGNTFFELEFEKTSTAFKNKDYVKAIDGAASLLLEVLKEILQDVEAKLDASKVRNLTDVAEKIGGGLPRERFSLEQMASLFRQSSLMKDLGEIDDQQQSLVFLLGTYDLGQVTILIRHLQTEMRGYDSDEHYDLKFRFPVQHLLFCLAAFLNYGNRLRLTTIEVLPNQEEINRIYEEFHTKRMQVMLLLGLDPATDAQIGLKLFDLVKDRGLLFNQSDGTRNVSFKVATFINLLTQIHDGITRHTVRTAQQSNPTQIAEEILHKAGYDCGIRFGTEMYESNQRQRAVLTDSQKVDRWCEFDSDVGFGRFHNHLQFNRDNRQRLFEVEGRITLSDNFLVLNKLGDGTPHLCSFMTGYIQGVLEKIFRTQFSVKHDLRECEQGSPVNNESVFQITTIAS